MIKHWIVILLLCDIYLSSAVNHRALRSHARKRRSCPSPISLCKCGGQGQITCTKRNCLQAMPTANMTDADGVRFRSVIVSRYDVILIVFLSEPSSTRDTWLRTRSYVRGYRQAPPLSWRSPSRPLTCFGPG